MKQYEIIYADPPWPERGGGRITRGAQRHYTLMSVSDIAKLPVKDLATKNSHLYLWVTNNYLPAGLEVMREWGFVYKTCITWVKHRIGLGQYFRGQTEHCLFGVRGNLPYKSVDGKRQQGRTVLIADRGEHSSKPSEMRDMIELVSDRAGFNKLELFARSQHEGWNVFGNEVENSIVLASN